MIVQAVKKQSDLHPVGIHGLARVEIEVLEIWGNLLCIVTLYLGLELLYVLLTLASFFELLNHLLQVAWQR